MAGRQNIMISQDKRVWTAVYSFYAEAISIKANKKSSPDARKTLMSLDDWYQSTLCETLQSRMKDGIHVTLEELATLMKWKLARGKFRPRLQQLVESNPAAEVEQLSRLSFQQLLKQKKLKHAVETMSKLKGVGPATASAILAAGCPDLAAFMSDESTTAVLASSSLKYSLPEYVEFIEGLRGIQSNLTDDIEHWSLAKVERTLWTYEILQKEKPDIVKGILEGTCEAQTSSKKRSLDEIENEKNTETIKKKK